MRLSLGELLTDHLSRKYYIDRLKCNQILVLIITFFVYVFLHMSRRPISIVKSELNRNCTANDDNTDHNNVTNWCDWEPFDGEDAQHLLGWLDTSYLLTYAVFMFVAGYVAERCNLRYFLAVSLILCGMTTILFGLAYPLHIHQYWYFIAVQVLSGIVQTTGWPAVVAAVGNWYGNAKKGLIFGIWSWHTAIGNIVGAALAGAFVEENWGLSFIVPGLICLGMAVVVFLFLIPTPQSVGLSTDDNPIDINNEKVEIKVEKVDNDNNDRDNHDNHAISFFGALKLPGVLEFSICLFFAKLVSYTFLYWLPLYISQSIKVSSSESAYLSIMFDIGGGIGAILAGYIADRTEASAITCIGFLVLAIPSLMAYYLWGTLTMTSNECLQFIAGMFVNGPYSLITTAVSADLARRIESKSALATVSAIIDGTGSIGAAVGPALAGYVEGFGWGYVFYMVMIADFLAVVSLLRTGINEFKQLYALRRLRKIEGQINSAFEDIK